MASSLQVHSGSIIIRIVIIQIVGKAHSKFNVVLTNTLQKLEMWVNAQRDGCPAEYRWRPLFNAAKFG